MDDDFLTKYYKIASSSTSRKIIFLLGENGTYKATELIAKLNVSPGTFYDALKKLQGIVEKSEDGQYRLTNVGKKIYYLLLDESKGIYSIPSTLANIVFSVPLLFPIPLMRHIQRLSTPAVVSYILLILLVGLPSIAMSRLLPVVLIMFPPYLNIDFSQNILFLLIDMFFVVSIVYFLSNIFGMVVDIKKFLLAVLMSFLPIILFSIIYFALYYSVFIYIHFLTYLLIYLIPLLFSFTILTTSIFAFANLRVEAAFMVSLIVLLISFIGTQIVFNIIFLI